MSNVQELTRTASQIRRDIVRMVCEAKSGHPGGSLSSTDVMTALYFHVMKQDPAKWTRDGKDADVFILSAGHLAPVYYATLSRAGYFPPAELGTLRKFGTRLQGHPCVETGLPGIFQPSGSLGQGLSVAAGFALGKKMDGEKNYVFTLMETARARKDRSGRPQSSPPTTSSTTLSPSPTGTASRSTVPSRTSPDSETSPTSGVHSDGTSSS